MQTVRTYTTDFQRQIVSHAHESMIGTVSVMGIVQSEDDGRVLLVRRPSTSHLIAGHTWTLPGMHAGSAEMLEDLAVEMFSHYLGAEFRLIGFGEPYPSEDKSRLIVPALATVTATTMEELTAEDQYDCLSPGREAEFGAPIDHDSAHLLRTLDQFAIS
ncbi:hypothetical protein [Nocardia sp. CDC160]|uniref:hypothetical protein n=1 Tax=Nocardia sp. CDC160 TaxID=3112166 RepID=UPI002DB750C7|nr:hypothetical protein [Nocardia sp. CDC160]MEC3917947.1 hypothetical protein [Nocardia sp. CDC160]